MFPLCVHSDTPADRAEFAQPDCAIVFTFLSYFCDGLSKEEVLEAFRHVLELGPTAQQEVYTGILASTDSLLEDHRESLSSIKKVDMDNLAQRELVHRYFGFNKRLISF